jgi:hypothetical protein
MRLRDQRLRSLTDPHETLYDPIVPAMMKVDRADAGELEDILLSAGAAHFKDGPAMREHPHGRRRALRRHDYRYST